MPRTRIWLRNPLVEIAIIVQTTGMNIFQHNYYCRLIEKYPIILIYHIFFMQSYVNVFMGCFHLWLLWMMLVWIFVWIYKFIFLKCMPRSRIAEACGNLIFTTLWNCQVIYKYFIPISSVQGILFLFYFIDNFCDRSWL